MNLNELTIQQAKEGLAKGEFSSLELTQACLDQIKKKDSKLKAFVTVTKDIALKQAEEADKKIAILGSKAFDSNPLLGIPYALKDNFCTRDILTTASSNVLKDFVPPFESTVSLKLKEAGAILLGKTNMDAFAHGSSTETSDFGSTHNPHDLKRSPGGSSGGSAAAVADNMCIFAIGSETAGSIRQPAAWCGVVGFKPTYGLVSRFGVIAMASSTDCPGPITKTVDDARIVLKVIMGKDALDATSLVSNRPKSAGVKKIGVASSYFVDNMQDGVKTKVKAAIEKLKGLGYQIVEVDLLDPKYSIAVYTVLQRSEVSSNLARYDGIRFGFSRDHFGDEAKRRIMLGTHTLSAGYYDQFYAKAQKVRTLIIDDFTQAFENVDMIVGPTSPSAALEIGSAKGQAMFGELQDMLLEPSSLAGLPAISIPCGQFEELPVGIQFIGNKFCEEDVFKVAVDLEGAL